MELNEILKQLNEIFIDVMENKNIQITFETTAEDIEEWDSLNHIQLVVHIEQHFKIRFASQEIVTWKNVNEICKSIQKKIST